MPIEQAISSLIAAKREQIRTIQEKNAAEAALARKQYQDDSQDQPLHPVHKKKVLNPPITERPIPPQQPLKCQKNALVSDTDVMLFQKKFMSFLTHREQILAKAQVKRRHDRQCVDNVFEAQPDYSYSNAEQMLIAYNHIASGTQPKDQTTLYHTEHLQRHFRERIFVGLSCDEWVSKDDLLRYLFSQPCAMMLYGLNPYTMRDELMEYQTSKQDHLTFNEYSLWLLQSRPAYKGSYDESTLKEAQAMNGKCAPLISKYVGGQDILRQLLELYTSVDVLGRNEVEKEHLIKKIKKQMHQDIHTPVVQIVNIGKVLPLSRLLYELQHGTNVRNTITKEQFKGYLMEYRRYDVAQRDVLLTKLVITGKEDSSYVFVVSNEVLQMVKRVFSQCQKYAEYFVERDKFLVQMCKEAQYERVKGLCVRVEPNQYVGVETVEETIERVYREADAYIDMEEIIDFFTSRGRPVHVEQQVIEERLRINILNASKEISDDEERDKEITRKQRERKINHLQQMKSPFEKGKVFNITVPIEFGVESRGKKESIRSKRVREMIRERENKDQYIGAKAREVPTIVKEPLYEQMLRDQQRVRQERLDKFKQEMKTVKMSERLTRAKQIPSPTKQEEYRFIARPMPWYCQVNLLQRIQSEKQQRKENILEQVIVKHSDYDLPEGVKKMIERDQLRREKRTVSTQSMTFVPHITHQVPDFAALHQQLEMEREQYKENREAIQVQPFSFENRVKRSKTVVQPKEQPIKKSRRHSQLQMGQAPVVKDTKKYQDLVELRKKQEQERQNKKIMEAEGEAVRKMRQVKFAPIVREALRKSDANPSKSRAVLEARLKEFQREERRKKAEYQEEMIQIYTKVLNRPLLVEGNKKVEERMYEERPHEEMHYEALRKRAVEKHQPGHYQERNNHQEFIEERPSQTQEEEQIDPYGPRTQ